jgi:hypothetical protein
MKRALFLVLVIAAAEPVANAQLACDVAKKEATTCECAVSARTPQLRRTYDKFWGRRQMIKKFGHQL